MKISRLMAIAVALIMHIAAYAENDMNQNLSAKQKSLAVIAACEAKGDLSRLNEALNTAFDNKALTVEEAKEALSQLYAYTGFPRSLNALGVLQQVVAQRESDGKPTDKGRESSPLPSDYDAVKQGTEVQTRVSGKPFNYAFAPATDYYLKAHLFGDIFARDVLAANEREIVTLSALSAIEGVEPQLKSHVSGASNMGVTDAQLHEIPTILAENVGDIESYRASKAIAEVYGEPFSAGKPIKNMVFPKGELNEAYAKYFIGNSYLAPLLNEGLPMSNVTFEPRCRNNWHIHHVSGQILICVGGEGWYQEWGKPAQRLHPGDVVNIPAEVKHWHGATADSWFQHIVIHAPAEGASNEWLEPVTDEEYDKLK